VLLDDGVIGTNVLGLAVLLDEMVFVERSGVVGGSGVVGAWWAVVLMTSGVWAVVFGQWCCWAVVLLEQWCLLGSSVVRQCVIERVILLLGSNCYWSEWYLLEQWCWSSKVFVGAVAV
jgi:hypothetical protein